MDVKEFLRAEIDRKLAAADTITNRAGVEGRNLDDGEKAEVQRLIGEVQDHKTRLKNIEDNEELRDSIERMRGPVNEKAEEAPAGSKTIGDAFVNSDAFQSLAQGFKSGAMTGRWTSGPVELPAFGQKVDTVVSPIVQPDVQAGIQPILFQRLTIADLLATGTTDSNTVRYLVETGAPPAANNAAPVAEMALKPASELVFTQVDEPVRKIATFLPVSDEMLEDVAQIRSYLDGRLRLFVQQAEETQLLSGAAAAAPQLVGILNRAGVQNAAKAAGANVVDFVYTGITNIRTNANVEPDGIVMHPTNWAAIRTLKDGNQQYYGGGPFTGAYGNSGGMAVDALWGLPVVVTSSIPVNTALVGAFRTQAQVFRRGGLTVEASNSHADFFQRNQTAIRAEERLALAVYRPAAFHVLTGLNL
jgi:HK97 family phage major capsid protein